MLLKTFEASLGAEFWDHCCVIYTRWGSAALDIKRRAKSKLTEEGRRQEVIDMLHEECPNSKGKNIQVYFTDTMEITEEGDDKTSENITQLYALAGTMDDFDCDKTAAVVCADWESQIETLLKRYNDLYDRLPSEGNYRKHYRKTFAYFLNMKTNQKK